MARVLIIEDEQDIREALAVLLESEGHDITTASNGVEGLEQARAHRPDILLLDLMMPVMDGFRFLAEQRKDLAIAGVPVVAEPANKNETRAAEITGAFPL
jgi:CheY-like chemotaxis protein